MDTRTRREATLELLQEQGQVSVSELSERAQVSAMTIRRDLEVLEREGALRRVHGGGVSVASRGYAPPYSVREKREVEAKARIGRKAASMLCERETVILDVGTTAMEVALALRGRRDLTVIASGLQIANVLAKEPGISLMLTGGTLTRGELSLVGDLAEDAFSRLRFDTYVMGAAGVDAEAGCTEFNVEDARVKRAALATVKRCIVVASSSKLGVVKFALISPLDRVDTVITDTGATPEQLAALESTHVKVVVV
jgi:DeoR/GlpR family transcriptional regulator of sugar metabolism